MRGGRWSKRASDLNSGERDLSDNCGELRDVENNPRLFLEYRPATFGIGR